MKQVIISLILIFVFYAAAKSNNCSGDACASMVLTANPAPNVAWQFTNNGSQAVKIGIRLYNGTCSDPSYFNIAPHSSLNWGLGSTGFCDPYTADYAGITDIDAEEGTKTIPNQAAGSVTFVNNHGSSIYLFEAFTTPGQVVNMCSVTNFTTLANGQSVAVNVPANYIMTYDFFTIASACEGQNLIFYGSVASGNAGGQVITVR